MSGRYPEDRLYHSGSMWLKRLEENNEALLGISHFAQESLGEVIFVDVPAPGTIIRAGESLGTIESHKAVSDMISPVSGTVLATNVGLEENPGLANADPYGEGWVVRVSLENPDELAQLLDSQAYRDAVGATD